MSKWKKRSRDLRTEQYNLTGLHWGVALVRPGIRGAVVLSQALEHPT